MESLGRRIEGLLNRRIIGIHGERRPNLEIVIQVPVKLENKTMAVDMEVINATGYALVLGTDWLRKAKAIIDYQECKLTLKDDEGTVEVPCRNTNLIAPNGNDDEDSEDESEDTDSNEESDATNFAGLTYELSQREASTIYKITSEEIRTSSKHIDWETHDYLTYCFDGVRGKRINKK